MQAFRTSAKRGRSHLTIQKRFGGSDKAWVPADIPVILSKKKSVDTVAKITTTMRNVAAGKLPSCQQFLAGTRPFARTVGPMYETETVPAGVKKHLHLLVGCERGLCGVVGANLPKEVTKVVRKAEKEGETENEVIVLGRKSTLKTRSSLKEKVTKGYVGHKMKMPTLQSCFEVVDDIQKTAPFDRCTLYYNKFNNVTSFGMDSMELYSDAINKQIAEVQFDQYDVEGDESTILQNLAEFKFATSLYNCMAEQLASEMGSRLASMDSASKTCNEKSKEYFSIYQRLRKTKITNELTVLSVGAKLSKKEK